MDPFAAIGLAGNIIAFVDFGFKLIAQAKGIYSSSSGTSQHNEDVETLTLSFLHVSKALQVPRLTSGMVDEEVKLHELALKCASVSTDLIGLLEGIRAKNPKSKRESLASAFRDWRKKEKLSEMESQLDSCKQQLNLQLTSLLRAETMERLNKLVAYGQATGDELQHLNNNVEALRQGSKVTCISPEALAQIHSLLSLSDEAVLRVRQARVLDALRFEKINERLSDVEEAHNDTFGWLFDSNTVEVARPPSPASVKSVYSDDSGISTVPSDEEETGRAANIRGVKSYGNPSRSIHASKSSKNNSAAFKTSMERLIGNDEAHGYRKNGHQRKYQSASDSINSQTSENGSDSSFQWRTDHNLRASDESLSMESEGEWSIRASQHPPDPPGPPWRKPGALRTPTVPQELAQTMSGARELFISWLEEQNGVFHISGKPGSGKSTLMKYIGQHPETKRHLRRWAGDDHLVVGQFFFWKPGTYLQNSLKGLIRGLLHCTLNSSPDLIPSVFPSQWESSMYREKIHIEHDECQRGFDLLVSAGQTSKRHKFAFFIDGLDEFEGNHADLLRKLMAWTNNSPKIKICASSREWAIFQEGFDHCPMLRLHDLTSSDVERVVRDRLSQMNFSRLGDTDDDSMRKADNLAVQIINKSDGVFLWVSLILRHVENGLYNGDEMQDLLEVVDTLPTELEPMLRQLLDSIPPANQKLAFAMLHFACFWVQYDENTRLVQYSFMEEYVRDKDFAVYQPLRLFSEEENRRRLDRTRRRVYGICKGFLELRSHFSGRRRRVVEITEIHGDVVRLTHRSIVEFLESNKFQDMLNHALPGFDSFDAQCQTYLALLQHLNLPDYYFVPSLRSQNRISKLTLRPFAQPLNPRLHILIPLLDNSLFAGPPEPSYRYELHRAILYFLNHGRGKDCLRFCIFLDKIRDLVLQRGMQGSCDFILSTRHHSYEEEKYRATVSCRANELVQIMCAGFGFHEYITHLQGLTENLRADCIFLCLFAFCGLNYRLATNSSRGQDLKRVFKSLDVLFSSGGSPDTPLPSAEYPIFHDLLVNGVFPLGLVAFMLWYGVNPRVAIMFNTKQHKARSHTGSYHTIYKIYFQSEIWETIPGATWRTTRIRTMPRRVEIQPTLRLRPQFSVPSMHERSVPSPGKIISPQYASSFVGLGAHVSPQVKNLMLSNGHTLSLRDLLPIWFPNHGIMLQQVVDWILEAGVPINKDIRQQLQAKFGHLLRPIFDADHPQFIGWDEASQEMKTDNSESEGSDSGNEHVSLATGPAARSSRSSLIQSGIQVRQCWMGRDGVLHI